MEFSFYLILQACWRLQIMCHGNHGITHYPALRDVECGRKKGQDSPPPRWTRNSSSARATAAGEQRFGEGSERDVGPGDNHEDAMGITSLAGGTSLPWRELSRCCLLLEMTSSQMDFTKTALLRRLPSSCQGILSFWIVVSVLYPLSLCMH